MSKSILPALAAGLVLALGGAVATPAFAQQKVSEASAKTLKAAQDAVTAKRYGEAIAKSNEALANPKKTAYDTLVAYQFLAYVYGQQNNPAEAAKALQGQIDSGALPPAEVNKTRKTLVQIAAQQRNHDSVIAIGNDLIKSGAADGDVYQLVGQSYYAQGKYGDSSKLFANLVSDQEKRGAKPREQYLKLLQSSYEKAGNKDAAQKTLEKLVLHYPTPSTWNYLLFELKAEKQDPRQKLHLYRLIHDTGNLKQGRDFADYSEACTYAGLPAESSRVLDAGLKANAFTDEAGRARAERYLTSSRTRASESLAELPKLETEAKQTPTGDRDVAIGMVLFSQGQYARAVEALSRGIAKGGLRDPADAQLTLGIAQLRAGDKASAGKTFRSIQTDDAITQRIAKLWALHAG